MRHLIVVFVLLIALGSCKKDECCDKVDQAWLDATIAEISRSDIKQYFYIAKGEYNGEFACQN